MANVMIASKDRKCWCVDDEMVTIQEAAQKTLRPGEALSMGISPPKPQMVTLGRGLYNVPIWEPHWHPSRYCHKVSCTVALSRPNEAYTFASVKKSLIHFWSYSPDRVPYRQSRDIFISSYFSAFYFPISCISFVYLLKQRNGKYKNLWSWKKILWGIN